MQRELDNEVTDFKAFMLFAGLKRADLVRLTGLPPQRLTDLLVGKDKTWPPRDKLNKALGKLTQGRTFFTRQPDRRRLRRVEHNRMMRRESVFTR